jgi:carboxymethylenebutenolidase
MNGARIEIQAADGVAPAFEYGPAAGPNVLVLIDGLGMRPAMHEVAERLAAEGYRVLLPDLFYRLGAYTPPDPKTMFSDPAVRAAWWQRVGGTPPAGLLKDIGAYLGHMGGGRGKVGVTGYCMGGRLSVLAAETYPERVAAAAAYHPGGLVTDAPDSPHLGVSKIRGSVYVAGAIEDQNFTDAQRKTLDDALTAAGVDHVVELYQARHGWVPSDTPVHDDAATARHWDTLLALFARTLR